MLGTPWAVLVLPCSGIHLGAIVLRAFQRLHPQKLVLKWIWHRLLGHNPVVGTSRHGAYW
jgi:hypothetical protein